MYPAADLRRLPRVISFSLQISQNQDALEEEIVREAVKRAKKDLEDFLEDDEEERALLELKLREVELQMNLVNRKKHR